jgi:hypothetical protein
VFGATDVLGQQRGAFFLDADDWNLFFVGKDLARICLLASFSL